MATISSYPFVRHLRTSTTSHVHHLSAGQVRHSGPGAAFWFRPLTAAISEVPVDDREQEVLVRVRTADLQEVTAPGTVTFRFGQPELTASRIDFSIDLTSGEWVARPLQAIGATIYGATSTAVASALAGLALGGVLAVDLAELGARVNAALREDPRLASIGVEIVGVRFTVLRPAPDVEKALQTPAREMIQQQADRATYERRATAVEREAAIGENELANQIELARRQERLIEQKGANGRRTAEEAAAADSISVQAEASRTTALATAKAEADLATGQAAVDNEKARLSAYEGVAREVVLALLAPELAKNLPAIEHLVLSPDVLTQLVSTFAAVTGE